MWNLFLTYLTLSTNITSYLHQYNIGRYAGGENVTIDYIRNYPVFSTSYNENNIINSITGQDNCELECNQLQECLGYTYFNQNNSCNLLNDTGTNLYITDTESSFEKVIFYNSVSSHSIRGFVYFTESSRDNSTVYLDINHNGVMDENEPFIVAENRKPFLFENLDPGMYLIRQNIPNLCLEIYPGIYGASSSFSGKGFFDYVRYFYPFQRVRGGIIGDETFDASSANLTFILGDNSSTYLSFYDNYSIVLAMSDDIIVNGAGTDIFFNIVGNTTLMANVSVSREGQEFSYVGVLTDNTTSFDINETTPIKFVKMDFFATSIDDRPRNIISVQSEGRIYYSPSFAYYTQAPDDYILFINDCTYYYTCYTYCDYHVNPYYYRSSCKYGCTVYEDTQRCNCVYNPDLNYLYGEFNQTECELGCMYAMNRHFYPNYTVFDKSNGFRNDIVKGYSSLDRALESCDINNLCSAVSIENNGVFTTHDSLDRFYEEDSYFLAKRSILDSFDLPYATTTPTTTATTTPTTTQSTTVTTTLTTTVTTTQSTTVTTTPTTTQTTTVTTTPTTTEELRSRFSDENIAILVVSIITLIIIFSLAYYYCTKGGNATRSVVPRHSVQYSNPLYDLSGNETKTEEDPRYMDVFTEDDRNK